jgi:hypothetical protein
MAINKEAGKARRRSLENLLNAFDHEPDFWAADVEAALESLDRDMAHALPRLPEEFANSAGLGLWLGQFGRLLQVWPELFEAARGLGPQILESCRIGA